MKQYCFEITWKKEKENGKKKLHENSLNYVVIFFLKRFAPKMQTLDFNQ